MGDADALLLTAQEELHDLHIHESPFPWCHHCENAAKVFQSWSRYFVKRYAEKMAKRIHRIDKRTLELCDRYPWPGNIRELQNIVERSVILCVDDTFSIDEAWLSSQAPVRTDESGPLPETLQDQEKEMIEAALMTSRGKVGTEWGCCQARHSSLDPGVEDQATGHREAPVHFGALRCAPRLRISVVSARNHLGADAL